MLLIGAVIGIAMFALAFTALFGVLNMATTVMINTKSRIGALALATDQLEFLRSMSYDNVGTVSGIPSGNVSQNETIVLNSVSYNRHTKIYYVDDPADGSGYAGPDHDTNSVLMDYKKAEVTISWKLHGTSKNLTLSTSIVPKGVEQDCTGCGSVLVHVRDINDAGVPSANVTLTSSTLSPPINVTRLSDPNGDVNFIGVPVGPSGNVYHIVVDRTGYNSDQTYTADAENVSPSPADFSVFDNQTQEATFHLDYLGTKTINTFTTPVESAWSDTFVDPPKTSSLDSVVFRGTPTTVILDDSSGEYATDGNVFSVYIEPQDLLKWKELSWEINEPSNTFIHVKVYYDDDGTDTLIPDEDLSGNSDGFSSSPVNLSSLSVVKYPKIKLAAFLHTDETNSTPSLRGWTVISLEREPLPDVAFNLHGDKTIGFRSGGSVIYKYDHSLATDALGEIILSPMERDVYTFAAGNYDITESCPVQPKTLYPGESETMNIELSPHTDNSLLVVVKDTTGAMVSNAAVRLYRTGFDESKTTSVCGQTFWGGLDSGAAGGGDAYSLDVSASSYADATSTIDIVGTSKALFVLTPL